MKDDTFVELRKRFFVMQPLQIRRYVAAPHPRQFLISSLDTACINFYLSENFCMFSFMFSSFEIFILVIPVNSKMKLSASSARQYQILVLKCTLSEC